MRFTITSDLDESLRSCNYTFVISRCNELISDFFVIMDRLGYSRVQELFKVKDVEYGVFKRDIRRA